MCVVYLQASATIQSQADDEGESTLPGVYYSKGKDIWVVRTLVRWGVTRRLLASAGSREEAKAIQENCFPRLKKAADEGRFEEEFTAVKAELKAQVGCHAFPGLPINNDLASLAPQIS